ncbi:MAG: sigma-70 family RNA polymerase sigma factor [Devosia sp.]
MRKGKILELASIQIRNARQNGCSTTRKSPAGDPAHRLARKACMNLEISTAAPAWQKRSPPAAALGRRPDLRHKTKAAMEPGSGAEPDMSQLLAEIGRTRDLDRFELLFRHFAPRLKTYMARTGSAAGAEELMQETLTTVWNKATLYDPAKGAASTWIFSIARNLRIDAYRREKHPQFDENDPAFQPAEEPTAVQRIEAEQSARLVRSALARLPAEQAEVMRLAFFEDNSQTDIADALKLPLGTVKSRMRLALGKLRTALGDAGDIR